jgi:hypothetical protein
VSYNGSGTFNINSAGQPVVSGTVISSTAFNLLTADLGTGLSTALTKDGQTTPTANISLGTYKITNLGVGTAATDAARVSQLQNFSTSTLITVAGTDTITGTVSPSLTAYTAGQIFSFVVGTTNTGAVTLNIDGLGAKAVTRTGAIALVAGGMVTGQVALVEYDGTRFQLLDPNAFTDLLISGVLTYGGVTLTNAVTGTGKMVLDTTPTIATPVLTNPTVTNYVESVVAIGTVTSSSTLSLTSGTVQTATLTASTACTFTMPTATAGKSFVLLLKQAAATGNGTATFTGVKFGTAGAPTITATAGKMDILTFIADGTNWYGSIAQGYTP